MFRSSSHRLGARLTTGAVVAAVVTAVMVPPAADVTSGPVSCTANCTWNNVDKAKTITFADSAPDPASGEGFAVSPAPPPTVTLTGPAGAPLTSSDAAVQPSADDPTGTHGTVVTATFDFLVSGVPAAPGSYDVEIKGGTPLEPDDTGTGVVTLNGLAPAVSSLSRTDLATDTERAFQVNGSNFAVGDVVHLVTTDSATDLTPPIASQAIAAQSIAGTLDLTGVTPGTYDVVVVHPGTDQSSATTAADRLVVSAQPAIDAAHITPSSVGQGAGLNDHDGLMVTIPVTNFAPSTDPTDADVAFSGTGVTATVTDIAADEADPSVTDVVAVVTAAQNATTGARTLTLTDTRTSAVQTASFGVDPAPAITGVSTGTSAGTVGQGAAATLLFNVQSADSNAAIVFDPGSGVGAISETPSGSPPTTFSVPVNVASDAPVGQVGMSIVNSANGGRTDYGTATLASPLQVTPAPRLTSVTPGSVGRGAVDQVLELNVTGLQSGMTVSGPDGVTFGDVDETKSPPQVTVTVGSGVPAAPIDVTLTNPDGGTSTSADALTIDSFSVQSISADADPLTNGATPVTFTVDGAEIPTGSAAPVLKLRPTFGVDDPNAAPLRTIQVAPASGTTATEWTGTASLAGYAAGDYEVQLVSGGTNTGTCDCTLTIHSAGAPVIEVAVDPSSRGQGAKFTLTVPKGERFTDGATVTFSDADHYTTTAPVVVDSPTSLHVPVHVAPDAPTGADNATDVIVTVPLADGDKSTSNPGTGTCSKCLTANPGPVIDTLDPDVLGQGAATDLTINGSNFADKATVAFGPAITATGDPTVTSGSITVPVKVDPAAPASVPVTVTNEDGGVATKDLTIAAGPKITELAPAYVPTDFADTLTITGAHFSPGAEVSFLPEDSGVALADGGTPTVNETGTSVTVPSS